MGGNRFRLNSQQEALVLHVGFIRNKQTAILKYEPAILTAILNTNLCTAILKYEPVRQDLHLLFEANSVQLVNLHLDLRSPCSISCAASFPIIIRSCLNGPKPIVALTLCIEFELDVCISWLYVTFKWTVILDIN